LGLYVLDNEGVQPARISDNKRRIHVVNTVKAMQSLKDINVNNGHKVVCVVPFDVWHKRFGHISVGKLSLVHDLDIVHNKMRHFVCDICPQGKQHRLAFPANIISTTAAFELIRIETWGP